METTNQKMNLDEAIEHLEEVLTKPEEHFSCAACKSEHEQLKEWLIDYRRLLQKEAQDKLIIEEGLNAF